MLHLNLFIVIPVHNRIRFTRECLLALQNQTRMDFSVVVVDDGSNDGTAEMIQTEFPETILLHGDGNLWWSAATNVGVDYALAHGATHVLTLNDDTMPTSDFVEQMLCWAEKVPQALLGALAIDLESNQAVYGGERGDWRKGVMLLDILGPAERNGLHRVTHFPGRGLLIPVSVFQCIGRFDQDHFPQGAADEDFTFRAAKAGYEIYCNYDSRLLIRRAESAGVKLKERYSFKNYWQYLFGVRSNANLKYFTILVLRNCPSHRIPSALIKGLMARALGYPKEWILFSFTNHERNCGE